MTLVVLQAAGPSVSDAPSDVEEAAAAGDDGAEAASPKGVPPHMHGPARPPAELLQAAQEAAQAVGFPLRKTMFQSWLIT